MTDPVFEIKIALLGYVSVGKTTVLNAILRERFSEVSMRRTTAGVSQFRLNHKNGNEESWTMEPDDPPRDAKSTLKEISEDNQTLRELDTVAEKIFDIQLDEPLCEMRPDTKLTLVDIPGINEAGASSKYKDFVMANWYTFDCIVVVMDARQGVNSKEQLELLRMVEKNRQNIKDIPVIILCNKVDDPEDQEQLTLVQEARSAVEDIFKVGDREAALEKLTGAKRSPIVADDEN